MQSSCLQCVPMNMLSTVGMSYVVSSISPNRLNTMTTFWVSPRPVQSYSRYSTKQCKGVARGVLGCPWPPPPFKPFFKQTTYNIPWRKRHDNNVWHSVTPPPPLKNPGYAPAMLARTPFQTFRHVITGVFVCLLKTKRILNSFVQFLSIFEAKCIHATHNVISNMKMYLFFHQRQVLRDCFSGMRTN